MPELTTKLGIKKPLGNETVSRTAFNENWDIIDANVQKNIIQGYTVPSNPVIGDLWIDTSTTPHGLKKWDGTAWIKVGAVTWDDVNGKPSSFVPSAHKSTHATGGADALTPADIGAVSTYTYTASDVLAKLKTVDGAGSGLDADTVDGLHANQILQFSAGNLTLATNTSTPSTTNTTPTNLFQFHIGLGGTLRISFQLHAVPGNTAYGQIYRNGNAVGTLRSTTSISFVTFTEDIAGWQAGDYVQFYAWSNLSGDSAAMGNFTIQVSWIPNVTT